MRPRSFALAFTLLAALACAWPRPALADGMAGFGAAAIGGALVIIGSVSLGGSLVCLVLALIHRKRRKPATQVAALTALILSVLGHVYGAYVLEELALVLVPGVPLTLAALVVYVLAGPTKTAEGQPFRAAAPIAVAVVVGLGLTLSLYGYGLQRAAEQAEEDAARELELAYTIAHDPDAAIVERSGAVRRLGGTHRCDLRGLDLSGASLVDMRLYECQVDGLILRDADLTYSYGPDMDLRTVELRGAKLRSAMIERSNLAGADLRDVDFRDASLVDVDFSDADLTGADLTGAYMGGCKLAGATVSPEQLATAKELWRRD